MSEEVLDRIIIEFGLEDSEDLREALYDAYMSGAYDSGMVADVFTESVTYFEDEG